MEKERNALKAGLFIVVAAALAVVVTVSVKGSGRFAEGKVTRSVGFRLTDDIGGLRPGDDVRVGGAKVGAVKAVEFVDLDSTSPRIVVAFSVPGRFKLRKDARVGVQVTLTGSPSLNIESLGGGAEYAEADVIPGRPDPKSTLLAGLGEASGDVAAAAKHLSAAAADIRQNTVPKANAALDSFRTTGDSATATIADVKGRIPPAVDKYNMVADKTGAMMQSITDMVGPSALDWKGLLANLNQSAEKVNKALPSMLAKTEGTIDGAKAALEDVQRAVADTKDITGSLKQVVGRNEGKLEGIIASLKTTGDNLKAASAEVRRSPWRLLYKPAANEVANLNVYDSARQFAEGATDLNEAAAALRDALKTGGATDAEVRDMVKRLDASFAKFREVEGRLWSEVKQ